jgi:hypothetical protein
MSPRLYFLFMLACAFSSPAFAAPDVAAPAQRQPAVAFAERVLNAKPAGNLPASANPFTLAGDRSASVEAPDEEQAAAARAAILASNRNLLQVLAEKLEPKGTFVVGGDAIILLGQKKLKVGERYPITFEGAVYELEITSIETTRFSIRYKNEEITRPIVITKTGK